MGGWGSSSTLGRWSCWRIFDGNKAGAYKKRPFLLFAVLVSGNLQWEFARANKTYGNEVHNFQWLIIHTCNQTEIYLKIIYINWKWAAQHGHCGMHNWLQVQNDLQMLDYIVAIIWHKSIVDSELYNFLLQKLRESKLYGLHSVSKALFCCSLLYGAEDPSIAGCLKDLLWMQSSVNQLSCIESAVNQSSFM